MTIEKNNYEQIINSLTLGSPVAESDNILQSARVDTPVFQGVLSGEYDIVTGRKGAGKTAIFRILSKELSEFFLVTSRRVILSGVNSSGESIFNQYIPEFEKFSEQDFENFWKLYFISLVYNQFIKNPQYANQLFNCDDEIEAFKRACHNAGLPDIKSTQDRAGILGTVMTVFKQVKKTKLHIGVDAEKPNLFGATLETEFKDAKEKEVSSPKSFYVDKIGDALRAILKKSNLNIWLVLDRLDEVFVRYSVVEFNGLRGLLRAYKSFESDSLTDCFKIKIFLRDDIREFLTDSKIYAKYFPKQDLPPLVAATHIFAKESPELSWSEEEIEQLILQRLLQSKELKDHLGIKAENRDQLTEILRARDVRELIWNKIFPEKVVNSPSLKWIYSRLRDSNGVVTPRSVIDMLNGATIYQKKNIQINFEDSLHIFTVEAIKEGLAKASSNKLEQDIFNEFPKEQANIKKLINGKNKLNNEDLKQLYGKNWQEVAEDLRRIGILRFIKSSNDYMVEFLFRPALGITYKY